MARHGNEPVAYGTFRDDNYRKNTSFPAKRARFVRFNALNEAGGRVPFATAAEFHVYTSEKEAAATGPPNLVGQWGATINFPLVPAAATLDINTGNILTWSSFTPTVFSKSNNSQTITATYSPSNGFVSREVITNTHSRHVLPWYLARCQRSTSSIGRPTARIEQASILQEAPGSRRRHCIFHADTKRQVLVKTAEYLQSAGPTVVPLEGRMEKFTTLRLILGLFCQDVLLAPMLTNDKGGLFRSDNQAWLFGWRNNYVFQAGPSKAHELVQYGRRG